MSTVCHDADHIRTGFSFQWVQVDTRFGAVASNECLRLHDPYYVFVFGSINYWMYIYIRPLLVYLPTVFVVHAWTWHWTTHTARTMAATSPTPEAIAEKAANDALVAIIWHILFFTCDNVSWFMITYLQLYCFEIGQLRIKQVLGQSNNYCSKGSWEGCWEDECNGHEGHEDTYEGHEGQ